MTYQKSLSIEEISSKLKPILGRKIDELYLDILCLNLQKKEIK
jgi:hypothetical protein